MVKELENKIIEASRQYYTDGTSEISDNEFDSIVDQLRKADPDNPILTATGWGWKPEKGATHPYDEILGIGDKRKVDENEMVDNGEAIYSPKLDGCSVTCYYKSGKFYQAISRGDGRLGIDVTHNVVDKVPSCIDDEYEFTGYVRTECVISYSNFKKHFLPDKSIRNQATGIITAQERRPLLPYVNVIPISVYNADDSDVYYMGSMDFLVLTERFEHSVMTLSTNEEGKHLFRGHYGTSKVQFGKELLDKLRCDYPTDGYICVVDGEILCAYKFDTELANVKVLYVENTTKSTGRIHPRIFIEETFISDCHVNKVTGKSGEAILNGKVGKGAIIEIVRSGEVIPNWTTKVIKEADEVWVPSCSYGCDDSFVKMDGANFFCTNPECGCVYDAATEKLLRHFASKGFSDDMVDICMHYLKINFKLIAAMLKIDSENSFKDLLYVIRNGMTNIITDGNNTDHQRKLIKETFDVLFERKMSIYDMVSVCSIDGFGSRLSKEYEKTLKIQCQNNNNGMMDIRQYLTIEECNNSRARESWAERFHLLTIVMEVFKIVLPEPETDSKGTVCITGGLSSCTKKEFNEVIESKGYTQTTSVTKDLTILICNNAGSSKAKKAEKYGVNIITENEFINNY